MDTLALSPDLSESEYCAKLAETGRVGRHLMFYLGDLLLYGEQRWGERVYQFAEHAGYSPKTMLNAMWVSRMIAPSRRRDALSFGHHDAVAALPEAQQTQLLNEAEEALQCQPMSVKTFRALVKQHAPNPSPSPSPSLWMIGDSLAQAALDAAHGWEQAQRTPGLDPPDLTELVKAADAWRTRRGV